MQPSSHLEGAPGTGPSCGPSGDNHTPMGTQLCRGETTANGNSRQHMRVLSDLGVEMCSAP